VRIAVPRSGIVMRTYKVPFCIFDIACSLAGAAGGGGGGGAVGPAASWGVDDIIFRSKLLIVKVSIHSRGAHKMCAPVPGAGG
jgi:hypothetical protein